MYIFIWTLGTILAIAIPIGSVLFFIPKLVNHLNAVARGNAKPWEPNMVHASLILGTMVWVVAIFSAAPIPVKIAITVFFIGLIVAGILEKPDGFREEETDGAPSTSNP